MRKIGHKTTFAGLHIHKYLENSTQTVTIHDVVQCLLETRFTQPSNASPCFFFFGGGGICMGAGGVKVSLRIPKDLCFHAERQPGLFVRKSPGYAWRN